MPNRYDVSIDGVEYRLVRGEGAYRQGASRAMIDFQEIETLKGSQYSSREDVRTVYQTSWAGGSRWEKPLLSQESIDSYYISDDLDMLVEPGSLLPIGIPVEATEGRVTGHSKWVQTDYRTAYAVGDSDGVGKWTLVRWLNGTVSDQGDTTISDSDDVIDMCWNDADGELYILTSVDIHSQVPGSAGAQLSSSYSGTIGSTVFMHRGNLYVWDSDKLYEIEDPAGAATETTIYNDGNGLDWLSNIDLTGDLIFPWSCRLGISTADGVYLVKNVSQGGTVVAYIYRVDRDASGTDIGTPVATLAPGTVALDIFWHMGSLIISGTSDLGRLGANDATEPRPVVEFYHLTQNSLGTIGRPTGNEPTEFVFKMMYTAGPTLYIGGHKNIWAYDAVRGGIHQLHEDTLTDGHFNSGFTASDGLYFGWGNDTDTHQITHLPYAQNTSTASDGEIESNYFDFSIPGELKYLTSVTLMTDGIQSGETWAISIEADDGSMAQVATFTSGNTGKSVLSSPVAGYRFRYKLTYSTSQSQATPSKIKGVLFQAVSGEMVPHWQLMIDGTETTNVENEIVRAEDVFSNLKTLRDNKTPVTFIDNYESDDRSDSSTYTVRVQSVSINKDEPKELIGQVVLVGVT